MLSTDLLLPDLTFDAPAAVTSAAASDPVTPDAAAAEAFVATAGRALHSFGSPAHRLEDTLGRVAQQLGLDAQFFSTPTAIFASFADRGGAPRTRLYRVQPGEVNLEQLARLDALLGRVAAGVVPLHRATAKVERILRAAPRYGAVGNTLSFALVSATAAHFFGGSGADVLAALGVGLMIGLLGLGVERRPAVARVFEPLAAALASLLATLLAAATGVIAPYVVTLAGLIVLIPGFTLTVAMTELASRHLVSGASRLAGAVLLFLTLGFGVAFGRQLGETWVGAAPGVEPVALPSWVDWPAVALATLALSVLFRAHPRDLGWIFLAGALAVQGGRAGALLLGPELGAFLGAMAVGVGSNLLANWRHRPSAITQIPGLMLLVPGSLGFRSVSSLLAHDPLSGVQAAFTMTLVASALVSGLLIANVVAPLRRGL